MPDSNAEKIRRVISELARMRDELKELVGKEAGTSPTRVSKVQASGVAYDPLEEILGSAAAPSNKNFVVGSKDDDVVVVDISMPAKSIGAQGSASVSGNAGSQLSKQDELGSAAANDEGVAALDLAENSVPETEKPTKTYPRKPPPRKRR